MCNIKEFLICEEGTELVSESPGSRNVNDTDQDNVNFIDQKFKLHIVFTLTILCIT